MTPAEKRAAGYNEKLAHKIVFIEGELCKPSCAKEFI